MPQASNAPKIGTEEISDFIARFVDNDWDDVLDAGDHAVITWLRAIDAGNPWGVEIRAVAHEPIKPEGSTDAANQDQQP